MQLVTTYISICVYVHIPGFRGFKGGGSIFPLKMVLPPELAAKYINFMYFSSNLYPYFLKQWFALPENVP